MPDWLATNAAPIFTQMLLKTGNKIDGAIAANDNIAGAVVATLKAKHLKPIALSGQDASAAGVQNIISGWQTMTVYKYVPDEANAAAAAAVALLRGKKVPGSTGSARTARRRSRPSRCRWSRSPSVSGYLMQQLGRIPQVGDWVDFGDRRITVREVEGRRVGRVLVTAVHPVVLVDPDHPISIEPAPEQDPQQDPAPGPAAEQQPAPEHARSE